MITALFSMAMASMPVLSAPVRIEANGTPITANIGHLAPNVIDWDKDGKKDLLVGTFENAELRIYRNIGSDRAPMFKDYVLAQAEGANMKGEAG